MRYQAASTPARYQASLALVVTLILTRMASAGPPTLDPACDPNDAQNCVQPLLAGEEAPFTGQLLTPKRAVKLAVEAGQCKERIALAVQRAHALLNIDLQAERDKRSNDTRHHQLQLNLLNRRLDDALQRHWYEHPLVIAALSVAATTAVYAGAVKTVDALR